MKFFQKLKNVSRKEIGFLCIAAVLAFVAFTGLKGFVPAGMMTKASPEQQTKNTLAAVGALMVLPVDEAPTIFNVSDSSALKQQQNFFANAENGDVLIVYPKSTKAIIYSPSRNIIVNVGPITFDDQQTKKAGTLK